jgi:microsomal dipeptidase-like Zn-dependent dipeptidase
MTQLADKITKIKEVEVKTLPAKTSNEKANDLFNMIMKSQNWDSIYETVYENYVTNGGYVGVNSARNFVSKDRNLQTVKGLVDQIIYLIEHLDINHVMLGLDMMDYLGDYGGNKETGLNDNLDDLATHADCQNIITELISRGMNEEDIEKIAYKNYLNMRKELLGY